MNNQNILYLSLKISLGIPIGNPFASQFFHIVSIVLLKSSGVQIQCLHKIHEILGLLPKHYKDNINILENLIKYNFLTI